jgi:hypothetical protein
MLDPWWKAVQKIDRIGAFDARGFIFGSVRLQAKITPTTYPQYYPAERLFPR